MTEQEKTVLLTKVRAIEGWLWDEEIQKLYQLAFAARHGAIEVGCYKGKSTTVIALGLQASMHSVRFHCIDISADHIAIAKRNVTDVAHYPCHFHHGTSAMVIPTLERQSFDFAFIDGDHTYEGVRSDIVAISPLIPPHGIIAFHDYFDARNDTGTEGYGVVRAVSDTLSKEFVLKGQCVSMAVFQRQ